MPKKPSNRAGAIEGLVLRFGEERPRPPLKPFLLTYTGVGVEQVEDVGLFQNGTTAEIGREMAERMRGQPDWRVEPRPQPPADEDADEDED